MSSVSHVAGNVVRLGPRIMQRCAFCGTKLADNHRVAMPAGQGEFPTWECGAFVRVTDGNPSREERIGHWDDPNIERVPDDFCFHLVE